MDFQFGNKGLPLGSPASTNLSKNKEASPANFSSVYENNFKDNKDQNLNFSGFTSPSSQLSIEENESFRVYVRIRPLTQKEQTSQNNKRRPTVIKAEDTKIYVLTPNVLLESPYKQEKSYNFDRIFNSDLSTMDVYQTTLVPTVQKVLNGYNSTILAYGMTGAGKTFTMFGDIYNTMGGLRLNPGVVSLVVKDLFHAFQHESNSAFDFTIKLSYLEIYNEHARDLLAHTSDDLMIIEDSQRGIIIPNLSEFPISSHDEILQYILQGNSRRVMASTNANQFSSRSHAIIQLVVEKREKSKNAVDTYFQSKLCLVDLAGSERAAVSDNRGIRQREGANINRSLLALGNCINVLSDPHKKGAFVPYRDSKLTRLLKDSLGGNTRTVMLACISPSYLAYEETLNTLKYASGARNIKRKVTQNVKEVELHVSEYKAIIESLKVEVTALKEKLFERRNSNEELESKNNSKVSSDYVAKIDNCLDDLGQKLLAIFEESWEVSQSINELKGLREQNETILKGKIKELENAVGDVPLYNKVTEEISALKEVMGNNDNILKEMEANLQASSQEKNVVQGQILEIISQSARGAQITQSDENFQHINKGFQLLERESQILDLNFSSRKEVPVLVKENIKKDDKIRNLEEELQLMKKRLDEKDKVIAKNEQVIKAFHVSNKKAETPKATTFTAKKLVSNHSPVKNKTATNTPKESFAQGPYKFDKGQETFTISANRAIGRNRMTSPTAKINKILNVFKSPDRFSATPQSNMNSTNSSTIFARLSELKSLSKKTIEVDLSENSAKMQQNPQKRLQPTKSTNNLNKPGHKKTRSKQKSFGPISIEDLKNYSENLNKLKFENNANKKMESASAVLKYQSRKKKLEEANIKNYHSTKYEIVDPSPINYSSVRTPQAQANFNTFKSYESAGYSKSSNKQQVLTIPRDQQLPIQLNSSPDLSSIEKSMEHSRDLSVKESFLDNFGEEMHEKGDLAKELEKGEQKDKEKLQFREIGNVFIPDNQNETVKRSQYSSNPRQVYLDLQDNVTTKSIKKEIIKSIQNFNSVQPFMGHETSLMSSPESRNKVNKGSISPNNALNNKLQTTSLELERKKQADLINKRSLEINPKMKEVFSPSIRSSLRSNTTEIPHFNFSIPENVALTEGNERPKRNIQSLEVMRELVKSFRSKLHKLASAIDNNPMEENLYKEIEEFLEEQKSRSQSYLLNNADIEALKKLENFVSEGFEQTETNNITDLQEKFGLNPYRFPQGDTTSLVNATELSRDLYSRNPTDRENQDKQEKALEVSRLDKDSSEEGKSLPKSSYPIVNDVSSDVLDGGESEFGLTSRRERDETPEKEENKEIEKEEMGASSTLIRRNRSLTPAHGDNEEVESAKTSPEKVVNRSIDKEVKEIPINVSKAGTYVFLVLIAIAILLVLNVFFNFPFGLNEDYQDVFGEDVSN